MCGVDDNEWSRGLYFEKQMVCFYDLFCCVLCSDLDGDMEI